jgi:hypothetical protein
VPSQIEELTQAHIPEIITVPDSPVSVAVSLTTAEIIEQMTDFPNVPVQPLVHAHYSGPWHSVTDSIRFFLVAQRSSRQPSA